MTRWVVEHHRGPAAELHGMEVPDDGTARVWVLEVTAPAVVLGSTQRDDVVDAVAASAAGVDVARRRSGGGAVWVAPGDPHWVDVIVPRDHPSWTDDVGRAFLPVGRAWQAALASVGVAGTRVHEGALACGPLGGTVCFAGRGPGEVLRGDAKVVGISQRRTRAGARFQCAVPVVWEPAPLAALLSSRPDVDVLAGVGAGIGDHVSGDELVAALVAALV
ncbi:MAG: lipoyl protein ligase domain-containing protein [Acidimicrobiia bacterium]